MEVAIVGCGTIADSYAEGIAAHPDLAFVAAADLDRPRATELLSEHGAGSATAYGDLDALLAAEDAPVVVNLTPPTAHAAVTETALRADRHVHTEKPLAMSGQRARELVALADERDRRLGCAPVAPLADPWLVARRYLAEGRLGEAGVAEVTCHLGRPSEWHDDPETVLGTGPLLDGGTYPLALLTAWFGPVERVETAAADHLIADAPLSDDERPPDHVTATLSFASGPRVDLTASHYVRYQTDRFDVVEIHGETGALYLADAGAMSWTDAAEGGDQPVRFARAGREYRPVPLDRPPTPRGYADGVADLPRAVREGRRPYVDGRHGAHVVAIADAVGRVAEEGGPVPVAGEFTAPGPPPTAPGANGERPGRDGPPPGWAVPDAVERPAGGAATAADPRPLPMPAVGFGCSRYRGGEYVDLPLADALDAGYRLFDGAELYGNEHRLGRALDRPGSPDREALFLVSKVWNTNHRPEHVREACRGSLAELGVDRLDCYMLHWPDAWAHTGPLERLAERPPDERDRLTFPTDGDGERRTADVPLTETWAAMEELVEDGLTDTLGVCNVSLAELQSLCAEAAIPPAVVQVERHPYLPRSELVEWCHARGIRVMAHSPLSAPGLLAEPAVEAVAEEHGISPAAAVLRWNVERGVVPIPSTTDPGHLTDNLDVFTTALDGAALARLDDLADPDFTRE